MYLLTVTSNLTTYRYCCDTTFDPREHALTQQLDMTDGPQRVSTVTK